MAVNSGRIDLNADAVLFDRENEALLGSNFNAGVSNCETLTGEPVGGGGGGGGEVQVHDQKVCDVGDDGGVNNGLVEPLPEVVLGGEFGVNLGCDVMDDGDGKATEVMGRGNGLEVGLELGEGGCHGKLGEFAGWLAGIDDKKIAVEHSEGAMLVCGGAGGDKGLVFELNGGGVKNELESGNAGGVSESSLLNAKAASIDEPPEVDNLTERVEEVKNDLPVNVSMVGEDGNKMKAFDSVVIKEGLEDSHASKIATRQLNEGSLNMDIVDVNAKESLCEKESILRNHHVLTSYELKQPAFQVDAQVEATQNQTLGINLAEAGRCELVVDLSSYRDTLKVDLFREPVFSELNCCASDLVWGKVRGHPWWPGQIFDSSAASDKGKKHLKEGSYLVAYFGDQTFAWNDEFTIKPFQMHFSQMVKQSNLENFHHAVNCALDEVSRRVEFGLSCPCIPREVFSRLKTQVITNAGVHKQASRRNGGDRFINVQSFEPMKLVNFVKSLAQSLITESDRLDFVIARAQLSAFNRSKGYSQLPEFSVLGGVLNDMEVLLRREKEQSNDQIDGQGLTNHHGYLQKSKHSYRDKNRPSKRHKLLSDLMSEKSFCIPNGEHALERKAGDMPVSQRRGRKRKTVYSTSDDNFPNSRNRKSFQLEYVSMDEMWLQLRLAATDPVERSCSSDMVHFLTEFRNFISRDSAAYLEHEMSLGRQVHADETAATSIEAVGPMTSAMEPCKDSYWTDRIIQCISEEQSSSKNQNGKEELLPETQAESGYPISGSQSAPDIGTDSSSMQQDTGKNLGSEPSKLAKHMEESSAECITPTALSLKFTSLDSVPSITELNRIFSRFGPLIESQTELIEKSNRVRVVFKRCSDAETAFSSAGKYSIFGPALVSYRLKILPPTLLTKGTGKRGRKRRQETSSVDDAAV